MGQLSDKYCTCLYEVNTNNKNSDTYSNYNIGVGRVPTLSYTPSSDIIMMFLYLEVHQFYYILLLRIDDDLTYLNYSK